MTARASCRIVAIGCVLALAGSARAGQLPRWSVADRPLAEVGRNDGVVLGDVQGAAVTADGGVLLVDQQSAQILRLSPAGRGVEPPPRQLPPQWTLADPPVFEVGKDGNVLFEYVGDAAVMADGSVLVADRGPRQVLRLSPDGEVVDVLGGLGRGPGEFRWLQHVFALADTIVAYDSGLRRVTVWHPGAEDPEVQSLPQMDGVPTTLKAVASSKDWLLESNSYPSPDAEPGLMERERELLFFDAVTQETASLGVRHVGYDYLLQIEGGNLANSLWFLGGAQTAAAGGKLLFAPMDEAVLEVWPPGGRSPERRVALPVARAPYGREAIRALRAKESSAASGEDAVLVRKQFDGVLDELPALAPSILRMVRMGRDVWVQPFSPDLDGQPDWLVVDPGTGTVRATVTVGQDWTLLGGSDEVAVLLGQTEELEEQFVQARGIVRARE